MSGGGMTGGIWIGGGPKIGSAIGAILVGGDAGGFAGGAVGFGTRPVSITGAGL